MITDFKEQIKTLPYKELLKLRGKYKIVD